MVMQTRRRDAARAASAAAEAAPLDVAPPAAPPAAPAARQVRVQARDLAGQPKFRTEINVRENCHINDRLKICWRRLNAMTK